MHDSQALPGSAPMVHELDTLGFDGRVWVDVEGLVSSLRARATALDGAGDVEPDPVARGTLHARAAELVGRADALAVSLLDDVIGPVAG